MSIDDKVEQEISKELHDKIYFKQLYETMRIFKDYISYYEKLSKDKKTHHLVFIYNKTTGDIRYELREEKQIGYKTSKKSK